MKILLLAAQHVRQLVFTHRLVMIKIWGTGTGMVRVPLRLASARQCNTIIYPCVRRRTGQPALPAVLLVTDELTISGKFPPETVQVGHIN
jgi:hypothetical protein